MTLRMSPADTLLRNGGGDDKKRPHASSVWQNGRIKASSKALNELEGRSVAATSTTTQPEICSLVFVYAMFLVVS